MVKSLWFWAEFMMILGISLTAQSYHTTEQVPIRYYWDKAAFTLDESYIILYPSA